MAAISDETVILEKVKGQPHFALRIMADPPADNLSGPEVRKLVEGNAVSFRGWDFPHVDPQKTYNAGDYVVCTTDWERHVELWRMYRSSQFVYLGNVWDVSFDLQQRLVAEVQRSMFLATAEQKASMAGALSFIGLIYSITEMYVFAGRLAAGLGASGAVSISLALNDIANWVLAAGDQRVAWNHFHQARVHKAQAHKDVSAAQLIDDSAGCAIAAIREIFFAFNWNDPQEFMIKQWQDRLMSGQFSY